MVQAGDVLALLDLVGEEGTVAEESLAEAAGGAPPRPLCDPGPLERLPTVSNAAGLVRARPEVWGGACVMAMCSCCGGRKISYTDGEYHLGLCYNNPAYSLRAVLRTMGVVIGRANYGY